MTSTADTPCLTVPVSERDHVLGPADAPVTLLEYGDYECSFCGKAHRSVAQLLQIAGDRFRFVFREFPLAKIHPHAQQAAEAAEAAGAQGRFWEMHTMLFEHQDRLRIDDLLGYASLLGLDTRRFAVELESHLHAARVKEDLRSGIRSGVDGTPTFFVNGVRHNGGYDVESLLGVLDAGV